MSEYLPYVFYTGFRRAPPLSGRVWLEMKLLINMFVYNSIELYAPINDCFCNSL